MAQLIAPHASSKPGVAALIDDRGSLTWAEFNERVNRLIHVLKGAGLTRGDTFAVMAGNQHEYFEATAAAAHAGLVMVPVNWHWVADELVYVLEDSGASALIVDQRWVETAMDACGRSPAVTTCIAISNDPPEGFDSYERALAAASPEEPGEQVTGGPMFYTSGTTGFPKGVRSQLSTIGNPLANTEFIAAAITDMFGLPRNGVTLLCGPVYHSAQWVFSMLPLLNGSTVVMQHRFDAAELLDLIDEHLVTNVHMVPTQFVRLLKLPEERRAGFDGSSLSQVFHGAAPCPDAVKRSMIDWWGPIITEYYGGTEGGFISTISADDWLSHPGSIGKPLPIIEIIVTDDEGERLGPNQTGQLWFKNLVGSDFEYHNAPEKTAAAHLEPGVGTLGDVGYVDDEGYLYMADRKIDMIISGGVNIYPAEIEGVLVNHPAVNDAAVFGIPHDEMGEEVKAAVELADSVDDVDAMVAELIQYCRDHLAGYKTPRSIDVVESLPRSDAGKLQKRELRDPYWQEAGRSI